MGKYDELIKQLDEEPPLYYDHNRQRLLVKGIDMAREGKNKNAENMFFNEFGIVNNSLGGEVTDDGIKKISDKWKWALENFGKPLKNLPFCEWSDKSISYFEKRADETQNNLNKAFYLYIIWTFKKGEKDAYKILLESGISFLKATKDYRKDKLYKKYGCPLDFCLKFAFKIFLKFNKHNLIEKLLVEALDIAHQEIDEKEQRWSLKIYRALLDYLESLRGGDIKKYFKKELDTIDDIIDEYMKNKNYHLAQGFMDVGKAFSGLMGLNERSKKYSELKAESYLLEADLRPEAIVKCHFYESALKEYSALNDSEKIKELKEKIKNNSKDIKWKKIQTEVKIDTIHIDLFVAGMAHMGPKEMMNYIVSADRELLPNLTNSIKTAFNIKRKSPIKSLFTHSLHSGNLPLTKKDPNKNLFQYQVKTQFSLEAQMKELIINKVFEEFKDFQLNLTNLKSEIEKSDNLSDNSKTIICSALEKNFDGDYISSIHLFIPQIETTIRKILNKKGESSVSIKDIKNIELRERILGGLLDSDNVAKILGTDFVEYLKTKLTDEEFSNYRNKLCHGQMNVKEFNKELSICLIYIFLKLSKI